MTLTQIRINAGLSQQELADRLGTYAPTISRWETGKMKPGMPAVRALAQVLGVPVGLILDVTGWTEYGRVKGATK